MLLEREQLTNSATNQQDRISQLRAPYDISAHLIASQKALVGQQQSSNELTYIHRIHIDKAAGILTIAMGGAWSRVVNAVNNASIGWLDLATKRPLGQNLEGTGACYLKGR